jgi:hypothetical protein
MHDFTRRVGAPSLLDQTPATLRPPVAMTLPAKLLVGVGRPAWAYRVELGALALLLLAASVLSGWLGRPGALLLLTVVGLVGWTVPGVRAGVAGVLHRSHVGRRGRWRCAMPSWPTSTTGCPGSSATRRRCLATG